MNQQLSATTPNRAELLSGVASSTLEANKKTVLDFFEKALNQSDFEAAVHHFGPTYIQHNPIMGDGIEGLREHLRQLRVKFPLLQAEVKRVFAEADFVILHVHAKREPDEQGLAIVDFFRLESGKIVEHWEVRQPVPKTAVHTNGMF